MSKRELWIGLVHFKPVISRDLSALDEGKNTHSAGAYCNLVTWASNPKEFRANAEKLAAASELYVTDIENAGPLSNRDRSELNEELQEIAVIAEADPNAIICGGFFTYPHENA